MKNKTRIITLVFSLLIVGCSTTKSKQKVEYDNCKLLEQILRSNHVIIILGLDKADKMYPWIRVTDLTGTFNGCTSYFIRENSKLLVPYFTVNQLGTDLNTGYYRDLVISQCKKRNNSIIVLANIASFETNLNNNTNYVIELEYLEKESGAFELKVEKSTEWARMRPSVDYDKLKN